MKRDMFGKVLLFSVLSIMPLFGWSFKIAPGGGGTWAFGQEIDEREIGMNVSVAVEAELWRGFAYGIRYSYVTTQATIWDTLDTEFKHQILQLTNRWSPGLPLIDPYVRGGVGLYSWKQLSGDTLMKAVIISATTPPDTTINELKATSFGLSVGTGLRIWPTNFLGMRLGVDYDLIFSEDRTRFGIHDANENLLRVGAELVLRIPLMW